MNTKKEKMRLKRRRSKKLGFAGILGRILLLLATFIAVAFVGAYATVWNICHGPSPAAKNLFISTILETGAMQFLASWFFSEDEILAITSANSLTQIDEEVDTGMIVLPPTDSGEDREGESFDLNQTEVVEIAGRAYMAKMMIVNDPSRVKVATIYPWTGADGKPLDKLVEEGDNFAGINGGEYESAGNWGGKPKGLVVCEGEIQFNAPEPGDVMVGFNRDNILVIREIGKMTAAEVEKMVAAEEIRDAVSFKDVEHGDSNHFTKLIINGKSREIKGNGSGANPRTVIGQREDGTVLMLVTDGRGNAGHLGATAADLISIMQEYGAVNAANLDGGSSSAMYYNGAYEMTSVTLYHSSSSWNLPTAFVVERRGE